MIWYFRLLIWISVAFILVTSDTIKRQRRVVVVVGGGRGGGGVATADSSGSGDLSTGVKIAIICASIGSSVVLLCCVCCIALIRRGRFRIFRGRPFLRNSRYINGGIGMQYDMSQAVFIPGTYASYYYEYGSYHGPSDMNLAFYPEAGYRVHGGGRDETGSYVITGVYSPRTLRMGLEKHYQLGTGNPSENLGHIVTIQVEWNHENQQFEGKYYLQTANRTDENMFIIRFEGTKY